MDKDYGEHLTEAKKRALACLLLFFLAFIGCCTVAGGLFDRVLEPARKAGFEVISVSPGDALVSDIGVILAISLLITLPCVFIQVIEFILPAVTGDNSTKLRFFGLVMVILFYVGVAFAFFIMLPFFFEFMAEFGSELNVSRCFSVSEYMNFVLTFSVCLGVAFETPLAVTLMWRFGVINRVRMKRMRGVVYVLIFAGAAFITPPDVVSQLMVALPMLALFEAGNLTGRRIVKVKTGGNI